MNHTRCWLCGCLALALVGGLPSGRALAQAGPVDRARDVVHDVTIARMSADRGASGGRGARAWRNMRRRGRDIATQVLKLFVSGVRGAARVGLTLGKFAAGVAGLGSIGLVAYGGWRLVRAHSRAERLDALRDISFGTSGLGRLGLLAGHVSRSLGIAGAGLQAAVGGYSLLKGLQRRDRDTAITGALDLGAGALFGLSVMSIANPITLVGAGVLTAGRLLYNKRKGIASAIDQLRDRFLHRERAPSGQPGSAAPSPPARARSRWFAPRLFGDGLTLLPDARRRTAASDLRGRVHAAPPAVAGGLAGCSL